MESTPYSIHDHRTGLNFFITKKEELVAQRSSMNPEHPASAPAQDCGADPA
jgi:hypothetical protein